MNWLNQASQLVQRGQQGIGNLFNNAGQAISPYTGASSLAQIPIQLGSSLAQLPLAYIQHYIEKYRAPMIANQLNQLKLIDTLSAAANDPTIRQRAGYDPRISNIMGWNPEQLPYPAPDVTHALPGMRSLYTGAPPPPPSEELLNRPEGDAAGDAARDYARRIGMATPESLALRTPVFQGGQTILPQGMPPETITPEEAQKRGLTGAQIAHLQAQTRLLNKQADMVTSNGQPPDNSGEWYLYETRPDSTGKTTWVWRRKVGGQVPPRAAAPGGGGQGAAFEPTAMANVDDRGRALAALPLWEESSRRTGGVVSANLARAVAWQESSMGANIEPHREHAGVVRGLMQFLDATGRRYGIDDTNWRDPAVQIDAGTRYLNDLIRQNGGNVHAALVQYHGAGTDSQGMSGERYAQQVEQKLNLLNSAGAGGTQQATTSVPGAGQQPAAPPAAPAAAPAAPATPPPEEPVRSMPPFQAPPVPPPGPVAGGPQPEPQAAPQAQPPQLGMSEPAPDQRSQIDWELFGAPPTEGTPTTTTTTLPEAAPGAQPPTSAGGAFGSPGGARVLAPIAGGPPRLLGQPGGSPEGALLQGSPSGSFVQGAAPTGPAPLAPSQQIGMTLAPPEAALPAPAPAPVAVPAPVAGPQGVGPAPAVPAQAAPGGMPAPVAGAAPAAPASGAMPAPPPTTPSPQAPAQLRPGYGMDLSAPAPGQVATVPGSTDVPGSLTVVDPSPLFPDPSPRYVPQPDGSVKLNPIVPPTPDEILMSDAAAHTPGMTPYIRNTYTNQIGIKYPDAASARAAAVQDGWVRQGMQAYSQSLKTQQTQSANKVAQVARAVIAKDFLGTYITQVRRPDMQPDFNRDGTPRIAIDVLASGTNPNNAAWLDLSQQPLVGDMIGQGGYGVPLYVQQFFKMDPGWQSVRQLALQGDGAAIIMMANLGSAQNAVRALGDVGNLAVAEQEMVMRSLLPSPKDSREQALGKIIHFNMMLNTIVTRLQANQDGGTAVRDVFRQNGQSYIATTRPNADAYYGQPQNQPQGPQLMQMQLPVQAGDYQHLTGSVRPSWLSQPPMQ